jgi:exonuclease III
MKLITWNCNGGFRNKFQHIVHLDPDIAIIQECENPELTRSHPYKEWADNYLWIGTNKNKGIGIFARSNMQLTPLQWDAGHLELFLPCRVNDTFNLLAVWTKHANSPTFQYIGQMWKYLQIHKDRLHGTDTIIAGDLNSNAQWDVWDRWWNHSDVVRELNELSITSMYHHITGEDQGDETHPTFYMRRKVERPYHIDYVFATSTYRDQLNACTVGCPDTWLQHSDHMPIICEFAAN